MKIIVLSFTILHNVPLAAGFVVASARNDEIVGKNQIELLEKSSEYYQGNPERLETLAKQIIDEEPAVLAFSAYVWNLSICLELSKIIKEKNSEIITVFGGPGATFTARHILERYNIVDFVVRGEGEFAFNELIKEIISANPKYINVKSLSFKHNNEIFETANRPGIQNLDEVPSPYLTGILTPKKDILIETHRGCVFKCGYCQEARGYAGIRPFSAKRIEQEIEWAQGKGIKRISLVNSIYNITPQRVEELTPILAKYKDSGIQYSIDTYAMLLNERIANLYEKAGIYGTDVGLQTINREALVNMKRPWIDPEKFKEKHQLLIERNIKTNVHLIIGLPGDSFQTFKKSFEFVQSLEPSNIGAFKLLVLPGTPFYTEAEKFKLKSSQDPPFPVISNYSFSESEIKQAEVYARAKYDEFLMKNTYKTMQKIIV